jgi:hypothetical protein
MRQPFRTHWRQATCEEVDCPDFLNGFIVTIDTSTNLGQKQHNFLTHDKTRNYSMQRPSVTIFKFCYAPGNKCMRYYEHRTLIGRQPLFLVAEGDFRGNPRNIPVRVHKPEDWVDDFAEHQDKLATTIQRG